MKSANSILPFPKMARSSGVEEKEFLPAALEIVETPASPAGRAMAASIIAIFAVSLAWAAFSKIDIVASASGKVLPFGGTKIVQPFETGIVKAIHVRDGQRVAAGDLLIELDPRINESERDHSQTDLMAARLESSRLTAALNDPADAVAAFNPPAGASRAQIEMQKNFLLKQTAEYRFKIDALDRQIEQKQAEQQTTRAAIGKLSALIPIIQQRVNIRKTSSDREYTSKFQYFEIVQLLVDQEEELKVQQSKLTEVERSVEALISSRSQAAAEYQRTLFGQLAEAERKADGLLYDVEKSQQKINSQYLKAPISGTVQQLAVHTVGGVVTPAQPLLTVVPTEGYLEVEAMVPNRDVGFVHAGQSAEIKVDTFNFTKYGLLHGTVLSISQDAIVRDKPLDKSSEKTPGADSTSSEPKGQELNFAARVSLNTQQMMIDDKMINLTPGMAVTVEIKTGSRSVLGYVLSPLVRYGHDSLKER